MKLYYSSGACAISPNIALNEAGIEFDPIAVDLKDKRTADGRDFLSVNSKGQVPTLEISEGEILTEGPAILQFIADQAPEKNLAPANGTMERYRFQETLNFITSELHKGFPAFFQSYGYPEETKPVAREHLRKKLAYVDEILSQQDFFFGDQFTLADGYLYNVTRWSPAAEIDVQSEFPNLYAFMERMEQRPSVQRTIEIEQIEPFTAQQSQAA